MANLRDIIDSRHPQYAANASLLQFYQDCYDGGPDWPTKPNPLSRAIALTGHNVAGLRNYIAQYALESGQSYLSRVSRAPYVDLCSTAADTICSIVGKPESVIAEIPDEYGFLWSDCDLMGSSLLSFMSEARTAAAVAGVSFILIDSTRANEEELRTEADVLRLGVRPYLRLIRAQDLLNWRLNSDGVPQEILYRVAVESPSSILDGKSEDQSYEYRFWNNAGWQVFREDGQDAVLFDEGPNKIGIVPAIPLYHRKLAPFRGESMLKSAAKYSVLLSSWLSSADTVLEKQSFSQAVLKSKSTPSEVGVGSDLVLHLNPGTKEEGQEEFYYASPSADPLAAQWEAFVRVFRLANKSMGLDLDLEEPKASPESGAARAWKFDELQRRLTAMTENEQGTVRAVLDMAARWKGQEAFPGSVMYSGKYDLGAVENDIERMIAMQAAGLPPTARRELMKSALKKTLPALPADVQAQIDREMETMAGIPMMTGQE